MNAMNASFKSARILRSESYEESEIDKMMQSLATDQALHSIRGEEFNKATCHHMDIPVDEIETKAYSSRAERLRVHAVDAGYSWFRLALLVV